MSVSLISTIGKYAHNFRGIHCETRFNLFALMAAMLECRTVCLYKCADVLACTKANSTTHDARYKRLIRFFRCPVLSQFIRLLS